MLTGLLATALLAPAQPPAPPAVPVRQAPVGEGAAPRATLPAAKPSAPAPAMVPTPAVAPAPPQILPTVGGPPGIDPCPTGVCATDNLSGEYSFNSTHQGPPWSIWGGVDYRLYWLKPAPAPGVLANAGGVPFGNASTEYGRVNGIGFTAGSWLNDRHTFGLEGSGFLFEQKSRVAAVTGPAIVRPFTDALQAGPATFVVADPALGISGGLATSVGSRLSGFEVNGVSNLANECNWSASYIAGFRYLDLDEYLTVTQASAVPAAVGIPVLGVRQFIDTGLTLTDRFRTRNQFYGGQVGLRGEYRIGGWFAGMSTKVGIGNVHQQVNVDGRTDLTGLPGLPGGFLATQGANMGSYSTNRFAVLVDIGLTTGYQFAAWGRVTAGYDFLYLNDVVRPGQQVDTTLNSRFIPTSINFAGVAGLRAPIPVRQTDDFYAHGLRFGLELMY